MLSTKNICYAYKSFTGERLDPFVQTDANEFFVTFLDQIEQGVKASFPNINNFLEKFFYGKIETQLVGVECSHKSFTTENFSIINLEISNKQNLTQCLEKFVAEELLQA